ncbi:MAG: class I SAM-dependent methyltransferase [Phycisphaerae bacterium]|nr:class I SAM-dependent methyltransferase [Phycisphaerae bacterium]
MDHDKSIVRTFYEHFGWSRDATGVYNDVVLFEDGRQVVQWYYLQTNRRVQRYIPAKGRFFLDAGSGPIPHPEYLEQSAGYDRRVCADFSFEALKQAREKLGGFGFYVQADITRLPFKDGAFDAVVAAHILYHVPATEQARAVRELHRATAPDGGCVILYTRKYPLLAKIKRLFRAERWCATIPGFYRLHKGWSRRRSAKEQAGGQTATARPPLYAHAYPYRWFEQSFPKSWRLQVRAWRVMGTAFSRRFVPDNLLGGLFVRLLYRIEDLFPRLLLRVGRYPMIVIQK